MAGAEDGKNDMIRKARRTLDAFALPEEPVASEAAKQAVSTTTVGKASKQKQQLPTYLPYAAYEQLRKLAFDERVSMNTLVLEGIDLLFAQRGLPSLSELAKG
jgi:hypothetical protein